MRNNNSLVCSGSIWTVDRLIDSLTNPAIKVAPRQTQVAKKDVGHQW